MALVIKKWYASHKADEKGNFVHLIGREAGLFAWLLSLMQLDPTTEVEIKEDFIVFSSSSLGGRHTRVIPIGSLTSAFYGYDKPWQKALALSVTITGAMGIFILGLFLTSKMAAVGLALLTLSTGPLYYFLNKTLAIGVVEASSWSGGFAFKRSVIEGQNIDEKQAYHVIEVVRRLIERKTA